MKSINEISEKITEVEKYENECEAMAACVACGIHPKEYGYKFETFHDLDSAFKIDADVWMEKSTRYMQVADGLKWVLKD